MPLFRIAVTLTNDLRICQAAHKSVYRHALKSVYSQAFQGVRAAVGGSISSAIQGEVRKHRIAMQAQSATIIEIARRQTYC